MDVCCCCIRTIIWNIRDTKEAGKDSKVKNASTEQKGQQKRKNHEGEIFRNRPDRAWGPPTLPQNSHRVFFPGGKTPGRGVDHPPPYRAEVKERIAVYLYSPSRPSWPVLG
jgi:hypothetical protein